MSQEKDNLLILQQRNFYALLDDEENEDMAELIERLVAKAESTTEAVHEKKHKNQQKQHVEKQETELEPHMLNAKPLVLPQHVLKRQIVLRKGQGHNGSFARISYGGASGVVSSNQWNNKNKGFNKKKEFAKQVVKKGYNNINSDVWICVTKGSKGATLEDNKIEIENNELEAKTQQLKQILGLAKRSNDDVDNHKFKESEKLEAKAQELRRILGLEEPVVNGIAPPENRLLAKRKPKKAKRKAACKSISNDASVKPASLRGLGPIWFAISWYKELGLAKKRLLCSLFVFRLLVLLGLWLFYW